MSTAVVEPQKHLRCRPGDVARYVLIPGDPGRAIRIAERMQDARLIAENRGYILYTGITNGVAVSVCSSGIGGPAASIAMEELVNVGAEVFIRVGSAGGRQKDMPIGTPVVITGAYRGEGTSKAYLPVEFPAAADREVTNALVEALKESGLEYREGIGFTRDAYYIQNKSLNEVLTKVGVVAAEQEAALLFIVGSWRGVKVGAIVATDSNIWLARQPTLAKKEKLFRRAEGQVIDVALRAVQIMAAQGV